MRILIVNSHRGLVGGIERYLQVILPALARRGHTLALVYEHDAEPGNGSVDQDLSGITAWGLAEKDFADCSEAVKNWKPEVIYSQALANSGFEAMLRRIYPCVLFAHNYVGTCATARKCHMFPQARPCERTLGPMCLVLHYPRRCGGLNPLTAWRNYQREVAVRSGLDDYRAILVASSHMQREYLRNGVSRDRLHLNPLPSPETVPETPPQRCFDKGRLLFVGRLTDMKGTDYLIRAIPIAQKRLERSLILTVAGDGPDRPRLEQMARRFGIQAEFTGWIDSESKLEVMRRAELLVVPSLWPEPFGMVGIEAGATGLPAAGYAAGGIPDWLIPGQSGELAPADPPTVAGLVDAIVRALEDPHHYARLCRGAWEKSRCFTLQAHLEKLESILENAGQKHGASRVATLSAEVTP